MKSMCVMLVFGSTQGHIYTNISSNKWQMNVDYSPEKYPKKVRLSTLNSSNVMCTEETALLNGRSRNKKYGFSNKKITCRWKMNIEHKSQTNKNTMQVNHQCKKA